MKNYVLGLDLGTSSIGVAALTLRQFEDGSEQPDDLLDHHVYLFKEPVVNEQGTLVSKKKSRRESRQARKQRDRRQGRLKSLETLCDRYLNSVEPTVIFHDDAFIPTLKQFQTLALRAHAATYVVNLRDLAAVIIHISKSRGYSSGFKPLTKNQIEKLKKPNNFDDEIKILTGDVQPGHHRLKHIMLQRGTETVGQYLLDRAVRGLPSILKSGTDRVYTPSACTAMDDEINTDGKTGQKSFHNLYALRDDLKFEFETIWQTQTEHHPELSQFAGGRLKQDFIDILFHQRPLKSVALMVGNCLLEPNLPRAPRAHPAFQTFRIEKSLADLRWGYGRNAKHLSDAELNLIRHALHDPIQLDDDGELNFTKIYKLLAPIRDDNAAENLNLANGGRDGLLGNVTNKRWHGLGFSSAWAELSVPQADDKPHVNRQSWVISFLSDLGSVESLYPDNWFEQFYLPDLPAKNGKPARQKVQAAMFRDARFKAFIELFRKHEKLNRLSGLRFDSGRASYSIKALNKINTWLSDNVQLADSRVDEHAAITALYAQDKSSDKPALDLLENPIKTGNGIVDVALMQVKKVVNHFIIKHGKPSRIVVEMAREMSQGISGRNDIQKGQNTNKSINKKAAQDMAEQNVSYSKTNVLKYRLAQDQGYECPYCGQNKFGARDIYDGSVTNIEHIVPQSITQVGRKYSEVVLAHRHCNDEKGKRVPMEAFAFHTAPIEKFAKHLRSIKQERKALLLEMPETPNNTIDDALLNEFCDRQFNETAWITKITATWLRSLGINVECTKGQMTAQLRGQWQLESVIPEARIAEGLPVYSTHDEHGEIKETIVPFEAMFHDKDGKEPTLLWRYWNKQRLTPDEFAEIRKTGLYNIDKRSDHRHHLIDAITTALCSRSMVQQLAKEYKQRSEEEAKKPEGTQKYIRMGRRAVPMAKLRDKALEAVKAQKVTHRPDRQGGGAWFQEMAYGLYVDDMQQAHLTRRYPVRDLIGKDEAATVGNIEGVIGIEIKKALLAEHTAFCQANWGNISPKKDDYAKAALSLWLTPPLHPRTGRPIIKVRQVKAAYLASKHIEVKHRNKQGVTLNKYLICDENAYIAWNPNDPADGYKVVNNYGARGNAKLPDGWMRVYKGDTVLAKNGVRYVAVSLNEAANRVETMQMVCATSSLKQEEGRQNFLLTLPKRQGSVSLWDIIKIQEDPFHGRPTRIDD